jgi:hypothetical protein
MPRVRVGVVRYHKLRMCVRNLLKLHEITHAHGRSLMMSLNAVTTSRVEDPDTVRSAHAFQLTFEVALRHASEDRSRTLKSAPVHATWHVGVLLVFPFPN